MIPRPLRTPLAGTAVIVIGLAALAVPLMKLTSARAPATREPDRHVSAGQSVVANESDEIHPTVARIRLLAAAKALTLRGAAGETLLELHDLPAGESEHDLRIPILQGETTLLLQADFPEHSGETAVFITLMPDGHEDRTAYAVGSSPIEESLHFSWEAATSQKP
jgi:hypothetical protein